MKNKSMAALVLITLAALLLSGCGKNKAGTLSDTDTAAEEITESDSGEQMPVSGTGEQMPASDAGEQTAEEGSAKKLQLKIADTDVEVSWEDNESVEELRKLCGEGPLTIQMSMYGGFEQVGSIGASLPRNDVQTTTSAGDIVLYSGDQIVVFYGSNSWSYTRLGHITDQDAAGMKDLLGSEDVTITISTGDGK